jgi:hypothetical protein
VHEKYCEHREPALVERTEIAVFCELQY